MTTGTPSEPIPPNPPRDPNAAVRRSLDRALGAPDPADAARLFLEGLRTIAAVEGGLVLREARPREDGSAETAGEAGGKSVPAQAVRKRGILAVCGLSDEWVDGWIATGDGGAVWIPLGIGADAAGRVGLVARSGEEIGAELREAVESAGRELAERLRTSETPDAEVTEAAGAEAEGAEVAEPAAAPDEAAPPAGNVPETLVSALACQPDLIVVRVDRTGRILEWPASARRLLGWRAEDVTGQPAELCFALEEDSQFSRRIRDGAGQTGEWRTMLRTAEGELVPGGVRLLTYRGGEAALLVLRDRRGSAASEQWLRWSRGLLSVLGRATLVLDPAGRIREIGSGWLSGEGPALAECLGRHVAEIFDTDRREVLSALRETARHGQWEGSLRFGDVPVDLLFRAVRDDEGRLEAIVGARKMPRPEESRDLFQSIPVGMILVDPDFRILEMNDELSAVTGREALPASPVGIDVRSLAIFQTKAIQSALDDLRTERSFDLPEVSLRGVSNESLLVQMRGKALLDESDAVTGYVVMLLSRTGKSNVEKQLLRAQKMESIGNFASGLAHDFGNFVSVILGKAGVLRVKLPSDPHITDDLEDIEKAAKRAQHLAQDLMRFARGGRGRVTSLDLNQLIGEVGSLIRTSVGKRIEVVTRLAEGVPAIEGDEVELQQMVLNLALNARDAMEKGGRLILETRRLEGDDLERFEKDEPVTGGVSLLVKDTGDGMPADVTERIFEPFFTTKSDLNKGTGLGLAMVYSIVRRHGGTVDVKSSPGVGTSFEIAFPAAAAVPEAASPDPILVVDDEPAFREMIRLILEEDGHDVRLAANGIEALRTLRQSYAHLRLVILDLRMPGIDGLAVLEELRSLAPDLPVLVTTGYASDEEKTAALERGAQRVLEKPYRVAELRSALAELMRERDEAAAQGRNRGISGEWGAGGGETAESGPGSPESAVIDTRGPLG